jgi:hypothetical protein
MAENDAGDVVENAIVGIKGHVVVELYSEDGELKYRSETNNLVTTVGDQYYAGRAVLSSSLPAQITGMKLGTGTTAPAKTGAGAALVTYLSGSNKALDGGFPTAVAGVATFKRTWAAGEATSASTAITEVVLVTDTIGTDATSTAANTVARALISGVPSKQSTDILIVTWTHTILGA